ncbi:hypothetical protein [Sphingomonas lacusdianchii]|uniref:hypothetical protein n=1 Tax=Sphingomonas lacusdianchii TaxID=2917992 RepID=UPI001F58EE86|nr:hypothetical protein [Sphingomonas sp. JXJ CY 53]
MPAPRSRRSTDFNFRRLRSNLIRNPAAMARLSAMGFGADLVEALGLGLKEPYRRTDGTLVERVLAYPLDVPGSRRRYGYLNLEGVTIGADHPVAWGPGAPATVRSGAGAVAVVAGSPVAAWQLGAAAFRLGLPVVCLASSQPDAAPAEWDDAAFWAPWDRVVIAGGLADAMAVGIVRAARRPIEGAKGVQPVDDCDEDCDHGPPITRLHDGWLERILSSAAPVGAAPEAAVVDGGPGDFAAMPIPVHGGFARGHSFYPFLVERRRAASAAGGGGLLHSYETLVLRSDGAVLEPQVLRAPAGTPAGRRVHALSDGTRIAAPPQASRQASWSLDAIQRYAADRAAGIDPCRRPAVEVMADVRDFLASRVVLPDPDDLWVVAAFTMMTHLFRVFEAIPLLLAIGPRGSGKSELAAAVVSLGFNAVLMGQGSAAALVRLTRECGGLVALDDAEGLSTEASGFGELGQCLKLSYKSSTARKPLTLNGGRVETIDFYGPRLLTTTRGVDAVLRSRCIAVRTLPADCASLPAAAPDPATLRDELHALAMTRAGGVSAVYAGLRGAAGGRDAEIWAPLRAIADTLGCPELAAVIGRRSGVTSARSGVALAD